MKIALLGHGVVGKGVDEIVSSLEGVEVTRILELPERCGDDARKTSDFSQIANDPEVELVCECMGGLEPAHSFIMAALEAGKHVVTSNKAVVAAYFEEFAEASRASGAALFIEATTGGGIPWIASIEKLARIDAPLRFSGILNGTTNYILDRMSREGADFDEVLAQAQERGYAEADPSADIDGIDVRNKCAISASVAFGVAPLLDMPVTGIRNVTAADIAYLAEHGMGLRLLGRGAAEDGRFAVCVEPCALPAASLEANVPDNFNLASIEGATIGELKFYGQGAGSLPTGNAMVQDILDCIEGKRPDYRFDSGLAYDESLLTGDYLLRCSCEAPGSAQALADGRWLLASVSAADARRALEAVLADDSGAIVLRLPEGAAEKLLEGDGR